MATNYEIKDNPEINKRIDAWITEKPEAFENIQKLIKEDPGRAARRMVNSILKLSDMKAEKKQNLSNFRTAVRSVIDEELKQKKNQVIAKNLDQKYANRATNKQDESRYYRDAETTLRTTGVNLSKKASLKLAKDKVEASNKGPKV